jgi:hypothetical protein
MMQELIKHKIDSKITLTKLKATKITEKSDEKFIQKATGLSSKDEKKAWKKIQSYYSKSSKSNQWKVLQMPPILYPGGQGCLIMGSSKVTVNGAPMAYVFPMNAASCTDLQTIPNASVMGTSNVFVGVTYADMMKVAKEEEVQEKRNIIIRHFASPDLIEFSSTQLILTSDKGFKKKIAIKDKGAWKSRGDDYIDLEFKDLEVSDDPEKNPKYTLTVDYGPECKKGTIFKDKTFSQWMEKPSNTRIEQEK